MIMFYGLVCLVWLVVVYVSFLIIRTVKAKSVRNCWRILTAGLLLGTFSSAAGATVVLNRIYELSTMPLLAIG